MSLKRFVQLFICFFVAILIPFAMIQLLNIASLTIQFLLYVILGYIILTLPLTLMTLRKNK
ncbi:hypothetical protein [Vagococcus silagei]|uniref:Uncharacterized protein n=1 Tax=Vagococcus silagei TaxID=2508885 RepID=A0A4S3B203_9ENTE|nr:hypothetical protein [Vagococcus silagei]THB61154.1 hypothetical protein ESZ54_06440 [Vagococcus silagei]